MEGDGKKVRLLENANEGMMGSLRGSGKTSRPGSPHPGASTTFLAVPIDLQQVLTINCPALCQLFPVLPLFCSYIYRPIPVPVLNSLLT